MARGHPDYFGTPIFPHHGQYNFEYSENSCNPAGDYAVIHTTYGKGIIVGGKIEVDPNTNTSVIAYADIDGEGTSFQEFFDFADFNHNELSSDIFYPIKVVLETNYKFIYGIKGGMPFEESFRILMKREAGAIFDPPVYFYWNKIE